MHPYARRNTISTFQVPKHLLLRKDLPDLALPATSKSQIWTDLFALLHPDTALTLPLCHSPPLLIDVMTKEPSTNSLTSKTLVLVQPRIED